MYQQIIGRTMHRFLGFLFILFLTTALAKASTPNTNLTSNQQNNLKKLYSYLHSKTWQPVDSVSYKRMMELIGYIESAPIDTVIQSLRSAIDNEKPFLNRGSSNYSENDRINGYISAHEINKYFEDIEKRINYQFPYESILVPDTEFSNMYSRLPIISFSNMEKLIDDALIVCPDSIATLIEENKNSISSEKIAENKEKIDAFLKVERVKYNDALIEHYRDSVTRKYRDEFLESKISVLKKAYSDSVFKINSRAMRTYNDSLVIAVNVEIRDILEDLLFDVSQRPNPIHIYNSKNEHALLPLQNNEKWFKWIWLKNAQNDSIGIRIENLDQKSMRVYVDETVNLSRLKERQTLDVDKITLTGFDQNLRKVNTPKIKISYWKLEGRAYTGITQTFINSYWSKGGKSSASTMSTFNYSANYNKKSISWTNWVDAKLGLIYYPPEEGSTALRNWHKNSDNFEINSRFGLSAFKKWYYSAEANFKTQFFLGYKSNNDVDPSSSLLSPAYLTFSGGFDYKPNKNFSAFISPLSVKTTYVLNPDVNETVFGLIEGETSKSRIGIGGKVEFTQPLMENVVLRSKSSTFINLGRNNNNESQFAKIPDFDTENAIDFKVNQFITTQINFHLIYDKDIESKWTDKAGTEQKGTRLQVKEFLTLGISYKF